MSTIISDKVLQKIFNTEQSNMLFKPIQSLLALILDTKFFLFLYLSLNYIFFKILHILYVVNCQTRVGFKNFFIEFMMQKSKEAPNHKPPSIFQAETQCLKQIIHTITDTQKYR